MESMFTLPLTGTPITGFVVIEATTPGRAADSPAMATKIFALLPRTRFFTRSGVLCAESTSISTETPNLRSN